MHPTPLILGWGRPTPTLATWRQGFRLQQGMSVGVGLPEPLYCELGVFVCKTRDCGPNMQWVADPLI